MHKLIVASVAGASSGGGGVPCRSIVGGRVLVKGTGYGYACRTHATGYTHAHRHTHTEIDTHMRDAGKPWEKLTY